MGMTKAEKVMLIRIKSDLSHLKRGLKQSETEIKKTSSSLTKLGKLTKRAFVGLAGGYIAVRALKGLTTSASDFEKEFANVTTLLDESQTNFAELRDNVLNLAGELGSATELTKGLYQALSAGIEPAKAVQFVGEAAKFAKAGLTDMRTSVDVLTTIINAYGMRVKDVTKVSDTLFQVIKDGKTTGEELAQALGRVIPTANTMGVELKEVGAALATLTKGGLKTDEAVIALNQTLISVLKPAENAKKLAEELGIEFSRLGIEKVGGLQKWLAILKERVGENKEVFAELFPNIRALKGVLALAGEQAGEYAKQMKRMQDVTENTAEAFAKQKETFSETLGAIKNQIEAVLIDTMLPLLKDFGEWVKENKTEILEFFKGLAIAIEVLVKTIRDLINLTTGGASDKLRKFLAELSELGEKKISITPEIDPDALKKSFQYLSLFEEKSKKVNKELKKTKKSVDEVTVSFGRQNRQLKKTIKLMPKMEDGLQKETESMEQLTKVNVDFTFIQKTLDERIKEVLDRIGKSSKAVDDWKINWQKANEVAKFAAERIEDLKNILTELGIELSKGIKGAFSLGSGIAQIIASKGKMTGIIAGATTALAGFAKILSGIFKSGIEKAIKRQNTWMELTKDQTKALKDLAKQIGDTHAATSIMFEDIIAEADVTARNFNQWAYRVKEIFLDLDRGFLNTKEFMREMGEAWNSLLSEAQRLGTEGSKAMLEIMREMEARGMHIVEIEKYRTEQMNKALAGYEKFRKAGFADIQFGVFEDLKDLKDRLEKHKELVQGIQGLGEALTGLSATTELTQQQFDKFSTGAVSGFEELQAKGFSATEALEIMRDQLRRLAFLQGEFGYQTNQATQGLLDLAQQEGILDGIKEPMIEMVGVLREIRDIFANQFPEAARRAGQAIKDSVGGAIDSLGRGMRGLRGGIDIPVVSAQQGLDAVFSKGALIQTHPGERVQVTPTSQSQSYDQRKTIGNVNVYIQVKEASNTEQLIREIKTRGKFKKQIIEALGI